MVELGQPSYRASQLFRALHRRGALSWDALTDLPTSLRAALADRYCINPTTLEQELQSADSTRKKVLKLSGGQRIETVAIPATDRKSTRLNSSH